MTGKQTDQVFHALAHVIRRQILDQLKSKPGLGVGELAKSFDVSRIAIMNHLAVLEKAELIISKREGRTRHLYLNLMPIHEIYERWSDEYSSIWTDRLGTIKSIAEATTQSTKGEKP